MSHITEFNYQPSIVWSRTAKIKVFHCIRYITTDTAHGRRHIFRRRSGECLWTNKMLYKEPRLHCTSLPMLLTFLVVHSWEKKMVCLVISEDESQMLCLQLSPTRSLNFL